MNRLQKTAVIGATLLSLLGVSAPSYSGEPKRAEQRQVGEEEEKKSVQYDLLESHAVKHFLRDYIKSVAPKSASFRERIEKHGGLKKFVDFYAQSHMLVLDAAYKDKESKKDIKKLGEALFVSMGRDGGRVDYGNAKVKAALEVWAKSKIDFFNRVLDAKVPDGRNCEDFEEMVQSVYKKKDLKKWIRGQHRANDRLYDEMYNTLGPLEKWLGGTSELGSKGNVRVETRKAYDGVLKWVEKAPPGVPHGGGNEKEK